MSTDKYQRLRDALAAGPTPGSWEYREVDGLGAVAHPAGWVEAVQASGERECIDATYIAAADPDTIAALLDERDRLRDALTFVRRGIESGHIEFSPIVLDKSGCFQQEHRRFADVVNAALGEGNE